jgi:5'-deoxynucleotidase YfbR-like HD superfamily hydrolase
MILSKKEKEETVIKLLNDGLKFKDIAKQLHISLSDISKIKRKITGGETEKPLSTPSKAFQLFLEKKSLVEVAIILDISKDEILKIYSDFLALHNMGKVAAILKDNIKNLSVFVRWFNYIKENNVKKSDVDNAVANIINIKSLTQQKENLEKEVLSIQDERDQCLRHYEYIKREINREIN